jgi:hypothetical protein
VTDDQTKDTYPNAGRDSGYVAPVGENIVNIVTGLVSTIETKLLLSNTKLTAQIKEAIDRNGDTAKLQEQQFSYMLSQMQALLEKEDTRHKAYDTALEKTDADTVSALANVALRLDQITSYVQQSVTIGREAHATGKEALVIAKTNAAQMVTLKKAVIVLEKGQAASKRQWKEVLNLLADSKNDRADLRQRIDALSVIVDEHNRMTAEHAELTREIADLKERLDRLERSSDVEPA